MQSFRVFPALCILGLALTPFLAGCGGGGGGGGDSTSTPPAGTPASITGTAPNGLVATVTENTNIVSAGGNVIYTYKLTNPTGASITITSGSASPTTPSVTLGIKNAGGTPVYSSIPPPPPLFTATLAPGQSLTSTETVSAFGSTGVYQATAKFGDITPVFSVGPLAVTVQ
ncbi:hypothetical protein CCAX7_006980 [Capsulimonas corticalis]|uniref:Uncharacterized protein n=1 Tax=Capsulimonas corticalis TaxID=2219043 RepID=A0A402D1I7_9BACT|nr:hypothetical protein [Capsulimonas corticalis]BDI28647.1 hypothetical protein CCAX7_006980 [Capsulimonas corticalis]